MPKIQASGKQVQIQVQEPAAYDPFLDEEVKESSLENIAEEECEEEAAASLSPHGMLLKVSQSTALQVTYSSKSYRVLRCR